MKNWLRLSTLIFFLVKGSLPAQAQSPSVPENLQVRAGLYGGVILRWDSSAGAGWYRIHRSTDGLEFHSIAELVNREFLDWSVYPNHRYSYFITAVNDHGESGPGDIVEFMMDGPHGPGLRGRIHGKIVDDSDGIPISEAVVSVFKVDGLWITRTHSDSTGSYSAAVDTGRYIVRAEKIGYTSEWYDNTVNVHDAFVVNLHQDSLQNDSTFTADFGLAPLPIPSFVTVTGYVDSAGAQPVPGTLVAFLRSFHELKEIEEITGLLGGFENERFRIPELGLLPGVVWAGLTDGEGHYAAHLVSGVRTIAVAFKPGYWPQFFSDKRTPFEADRISATHDTTGFDFHLTNNPEGINSLGGNVVDTSGLGIPSHVVLLRKTILGLLPLRFQMTDSLGNYDFHDLVDGVYLVKALPLYGYAPAWHAVADCGVHNWHNADTISVGLHIVGPDNVVDKNICVVPSFLGGFARIGGQISEGIASSTKRSRSPLAVSPVGGVTVYAISNATSTVAGTDITETDGTYSIGNLPAGSYAIVVDKEGYSAGSAPSITVNETNDYVQTDASVVVIPDQVLSVSAGPPGLPTAFRLEQNYPNPFNPATTIRFAVPIRSAVSIKIYNLIGQFVTALRNNEEFNPGVHDLLWNGTDERGQAVGSGIYFIKMSAAPAGTRETAFTQVRKMILLK